MPIKVNTGASDSSNHNTVLNTNSDSQGPNAINQVDQSSNIPPMQGINSVGLSESELNDPNSITVTIADTTTPIVILYGPNSCGKTMTLVRMARYLGTHGYTISPDKTFRPSFDSNYRVLCQNFDQMINSSTAAAGTSRISFMLIKVFKNGKSICQLLEAPGEYYFYPDDPDRQYPPYVEKIINSNNRKIWAIMVEPDWEDVTPRNNYVTRISNLKKKMHTSDKVVFVYNKIDKTNFVMSAGQVNIHEAIKNVSDLFNGIFAPFENVNPITKLWKKYNCEFVPFTTGSYTKTVGGQLTYTEGDEEYAQRFWKVLLKFIKG
jgi:hypothetical protein